MRSQRGFTLLELTIAMTFVALVATGIVLSISTSLNVWRQLTESADLNQESRAVVETISRDLRNSYMGLFRDVGFFTAVPAEEGQAPFDSVEFSADSSSISRAALLPEDLRSGTQEERLPVTDYVGVRYQWSPGGDGVPAGLYRTTWLVPGVGVIAPSASVETESEELISHALTRFELRYFDGKEWATEYDSRDNDNRPPVAVLIRLALRDDHGREHDIQTVVSLIHD